MSDFDNQQMFTRYIAAGSPYTPEIVLSRLAEDVSQSIRRRVAENPRTPACILERLGRDACADVRAAIAENPNSEKSLLLLLSADPCADVRYALAENHRMPSEVLLKLSLDENPYVSTRAAATLSSMAYKAAAVLNRSWGARNLRRDNEAV